MAFTAPMGSPSAEAGGASPKGYRLASVRKRVTSARSLLRWTGGIFTVRVCSPHHLAFQTVGTALFLHHRAVGGRCQQRARRQLTSRRRNCKVSSRAGPDHRSCSRQKAVKIGQHLKACSTRFAITFAATPEIQSRAKMVETVDSLISELLDGSLTGSGLKTRFSVVAREKYHRILLALLRSEKDLARSARGSFIHPNGFTRLIIRRDHVSGRVLRLHIWRAPEDSEHQDIHNHAWNFMSYVVRGSFIQYRYGYEPAKGGQFHRYRFLPTETSTYSSELLDTGHVSVLSRHSVISGEILEMQANDLHRFIPLQAPGTTLVLQYPEPGRVTSEMLRPGSSPEQTAPLRNMKVDELRQLLSLEVERLSGA